MIGAPILGSMSGAAFWAGKESLKYVKGATPVQRVCVGALGLGAAVVGGLTMKQAEGKV